MNLDSASDGNENENVPNNDETLDNPPTDAEVDRCVRPDTIDTT